MGKFHEKTGLLPLGDLPYFLRAFILCGLIMGMASIFGLMLNNTTNMGIALICLLWGITSVMVWISVSKPGRRDARRQKPADSRTGTAARTRTCPCSCPGAPGVLPAQGRRRRATFLPQPDERPVGGTLQKDA